MIQQITPLLAPPQPSDSPTDFDQKAFALLGGLPQFVDQANALGGQIFTIGEDATESAAAALASKNAAATSASNSADHASAALTSASNAENSANLANQSRIDAQAASGTAEMIALGMENAIAFANTFTAVPTTNQGPMIVVTQPHLRFMVWNGARYIRAPWHQPGTLRHVYRDLRPGELEVRADVVLQSADFPDLAEYLGVTGSTFVLDEARGEFIRNLDSGRGKDAGRAVGSHQGDAIRNISGSLMGSYTSTFETSGYGSLSPATLYGYSLGDGTGVIAQTGGLGVAFDASRSVPTASENRPTNVAYRFAVTY